MKKKVLQVLSTLEQGGTEAVVLNYFRHIEKENLQLDFLVVWGDSKKFYDDYLLAQNCNIYRMKHTPKEFFAHGQELKEFFSNNSYDIVHIHAMSALRYRVAMAAKKSGVKTVIYHAHTSSCEKHGYLHALLKKQLNKWCDYRFACSDSAGKFMYSGDYRLVHNAIDLERFKYNEIERNKLRDQYGIKNKPIIGHIGRLSALKNQKFLLQVLLQIKKKHKNVVLFLIGEGAEKENLMQMAEDNGLTGSVIFAGNVGTEVNRYYSMFDCLAFPSQFEGLSMVTIEAQANGLPCVVSDKLSPEHKIAENFRFLPIEETKGNYARWAECIETYAGQREDNVERLCRAGYDIQAEAEKLQNVYLSL